MLVRKPDSAAQGLSVSGCKAVRVFSARNVATQIHRGAARIPRLEHYDYERHIVRARVGGVPTDVDIRRGDGVTKAIP